MPQNQQQRKRAKRYVTHDDIRSIESAAVLRVVARELGVTLHHVADPPAGLVASRTCGKPDEFGRLVTTIDAGELCEVADTAFAHGHSHYEFEARMPSYERR